MTTFLNIHDIRILQELAPCSMQMSIKLRLNSFVKNLVTILCVPFFSSLLGEGGVHRLDSGSGLVAVQELMADLLANFVATELLIDQHRDLSILNNACVELVISLLLYRSSALVPLLLTLSSHGPDIVASITAQLLSVRALSVELKESVEMVIAQCSDAVSYYEESQQRGSTSLSTSDIDRTIDRGVPGLVPTVPTGNTSANNVRSILRKPLLEYISWLGEHREKLVRLCRVAEVGICEQSWADSV